MHVVVNPAGAAGGTLSHWQKVEKIFQEREADYTVHFSTREKTITDICKEITSSGKEETLIVAGGDGTFNEAVNGIVNFAKTKMGIIPCGSGNDLAYDLNVPNDMRILVDRFLQNRTLRSIDLGEVTFYHRRDCFDPFTKQIDSSETYEPLTRKFIISSGIGFDAAICAGVAVSSMKKPLNKLHMGSLIYVHESLKLILRKESASVKIDYGDGNIKEYPECAFAVGMNHRFEGGGYCFGPDAKDDDGLLDYCIVTRLNLPKFVTFLKAYHGGRLSFDGHFQERSRAAHITADKPLWVHTDGEIICKSKDITLCLNAEKLNLLV